jgi:hypothetical protein
LADGVRHFKESEGGRGIMCDAVEEYATARANVARENLAIKMLKAGKYALDEISDLTDLTIDQLKALQKKNSI